MDGCHAPHLDMYSCRELQESPALDFIEDMAECTLEHALCVGSDARSVWHKEVPEPIDDRIEVLIARHQSWRGVCRAYEWLVKGGEDIRIDQRIQQLFSIML